MELILNLDIDTLLNLGVLVELLLVFQELKDLVLIDQVKVLLVICVEKVEWLSH